MKFAYTAIAAALLTGGLHTQAATSIYHDAVLAANPVLYYQFNETSGNALNYGSLGASFDASYNGTPLRGVATLQGDAGVAFDSADDFLQSGAVAPLALTGNPSFSAEAVVFVPLGGTATLWAPFLHWGEAGPPANRSMSSVYFSFSNNDPQEIFAGFYNGGLQTQDDVALGQWHHIVWVRQGGGAANVGSTLYINGVAVGLENDPDLPSNGATPAVTSTEFRINRARDFTRSFTGTLDELALYDRPLSQDEVLAHFAAFSAPIPEAPTMLLFAAGLIGVWRRAAACSRD